MPATGFLRLTTALAVAFFASPACADLTVDDAWNTWKAQIRAMGLTLQADEVRDGEDLQIGQITISASLPMEIGSFTASSAGPRFSPLDDGTVRVTFPAESQISIGGDIQDEGSLSMVLDYKTINSRIIMSGTPDRVVSNWLGDGAELLLINAMVDDAPLENLSGAMNMQAYALENITTLGTDLTIDQTANYDGYEWEFAYDMQTDGITSASEEAGSAVGLTMTQSTVLPLDGIQIMDLHNQLRDGLKYRGDSRASSYVSKQKETLDGTILVNAEAEVADYVMAATLDQNGIRWGGSNGKISADIDVNGLPAPVVLTMEAAVADIFVPLLQSDEPQPAGLQLEMREIALNPEIWALADPSGELPRDPMTFALDVTGQVDINADLLNFAMLAVLDDASGLVVPVSANLKSLLVSAVGTELTGDGAFTFDATDTETFDGLPRPEGRVDLKLSGANTLIDTLIAMGLVLEEQAMGARMMMGLFTTPGEGEDTLNSTIEINEQGHVLANGQRLK